MSAYEGATDAVHWSTDLALGYRHVAGRWRIAPTVRLFHLRGEIDTFTETDLLGTGLPDDLEKQRYETLLLDLSARFARRRSGFLAYEHVFGHASLTRHHGAVGLRYAIPTGFTGF